MIDSALYSRVTIYAIDKIDHVFSLSVCSAKLKLKMFFFYRGLCQFWIGKKQNCIGGKKCSALIVVATLHRLRSIGHYFCTVSNFVRCQETKLKNTQQGLVGLDLCIN